MRRDWKGKEGRRFLENVEGLPGVRECGKLLGFRIRREMEVLGQNFVGDQVGIWRPPLFASELGSSFSSSSTPDPFIVFPSQLNNESASLHLFQLYSPCSPPTPPNRSTHDRPHDLLEREVAQLYPKDRERPLFDLVPRKEGSRILESEEKVELVDHDGKERRPPPFRCVTVGGEDAKWIVAVGDEGTVVIWRRSD